MRDDRLYLIHIAECISRIREFTTAGKDAFFADIRTQDAVLRNLQVMSESTQRLSEALKNQHADTNWKGIAGFRNVLVHDYLGINLVRVWEIVESFLPELEIKVIELLQETT